MGKEDQRKPECKVTACAALWNKCLLSLIGKKNKFVLGATDYRHAPQISPELASILQEIYDMYNQGLIGIEGQAMVSAYDIVPVEMGFDHIGRGLHNMMELESIDEADVAHLAALLGPS